MRVHVLPPSTVRRTTPLAPASQQTRAAGAAPELNGVAAPTACGCHVSPPSVVCSTTPATMRHCDSLLGEGTRTGTGDSAAFIIGCAARPRAAAGRAGLSRSAEGGGAGEEGAGGPNTGAGDGTAAFAAASTDACGGTPGTSVLVLGRAARCGVATRAACSDGGAPRPRARRAPADGAAHRGRRGAVTAAPARRWTARVRQLAAAERLPRCQTTIVAGARVCRSITPSTRPHSRARPSRSRAAPAR